MSIIQSREVSVVIIGRNAEWSIGRLLKSVVASIPQQAIREIIYVDSASKDRTIEIVRRYPVMVVQVPRNLPLCASAGRFTGSQYATGKYIVFLDSDMELLPGWMEPAMAIMNRRSDVGAITGTIVDIDRTISDMDRASPMVKDRNRSDVASEEIKYAGNAAMFRKAALDAVGSWNPFIISDEEPELCLRVRHAGFRIVQLAIPITRHYTYPVDRISTLFSRRERRLFMGYGQVIRYHLRTGLLRPYLRERGWVIMPALGAILGISVVLAALLTGNRPLVLALMATPPLIVAFDALRSRSWYKAIFHVLHRALILEGAVRGFFQRPQMPEEYLRETSQGATLPHKLRKQAQPSSKPL